MKTPVQCTYIVFLPGNMLEWSVPGDVELDGVEFKAMPSGAHNIPSDFL